MLDKCLEKSFYNFCKQLENKTEKDECFEHLLEIFLNKCKSCKNKIQSKLIEYHQKLSILSENNYKYIIEDIDSFLFEDKEKEDERSLFYLYKILIQNTINVSISKESTCEEVFEYITLIEAVKNIFK